MTERVPFVDLVSQQAEIASEVLAEWGSQLETAAFIGGPVVAAFEREYAAYIGVEHVIGVSNGTDALELAYRAVGVGPGDEVIMPVNTFIATAEAASRIGALPVFVDVDPEHLLIDPDAVEAAITPRTRAIVPVHLFGQTAPMEALPFESGAFELVWCEAAAYIMGVDAALDAWRRLLAPGGALVITECEWRTDEPSAAARTFWQAYPGMRTGEDNREAIAEAGYELLGAIELPESDWWDEYYTPLSERIEALARSDDPDAAALAPVLSEEILLRRDHGDDYGYTGYAMRPLW